MAPVAASKRGEKRSVKPPGGPLGKCRGVQQRGDYQKLTKGGEDNSSGGAWGTNTGEELKGEGCI